MKKVTHRLVEEHIQANSFNDLKNKLAAFGVNSDSMVNLSVDISAINHETEHYQKTIRRLRRQVRHLKSLIKSKDRLNFAQEEFYKCMLDECNKREEADKKKSTEFFTKCLLNALYTAQNTV